MAFNEIVFVTGFPGFLATRLVRRLAAEGARFILLTLPQFNGLAQLEAGKIATDTGADANNFRIIEGDITKPDLGLSTNELERTRRETTNIFHLAAVYDLAVDSAVAAHVNVEGTLNINNFAKSIENLRRYHYISTCYVAGKREGLIMETELHHDTGFRNHYEETKYLAELEVNTLKAELPITIHRLFNEISKAIGGRDSFATVPAGIVYPVLRLPFAPKITGLPHSAVPYFFLDQTYDTTRARALLEPHAIKCPSFPDYVEALVNFVAEHPTL